MATILEYSLINHRKAALHHLTREGAPGQRERADEALRRIEAGNYGYCVRCGMKIPEAVLERRPERSSCLECDLD
jgi:RNA polymerase-binding transcription factor DksA